MNNIRALLIGVAATGGLSAPAFAQTFQAEAGLNYQYLDFDGGGSDYLLGVDGTFHFAPVSTEGVPRAEAGFLARSSNVFASYADQDKADVDFLNLGGEYYVNDLYFSAQYQRVSNGFRAHNYGVRVGFLPMDGLRLTIGYDKDDVFDADVYSVGAKYLKPLIGDSALNLEGELSFADDDFDTTNLNLRGDYYFNHDLSAGILWNYAHSDIDSGSTVGVGTRYFFTPVISGEAAYLTDGDDDQFVIRAAMRF